MFHSLFADATVQCEQKNVTIQWSTVVPNTPSTTYSIATWFCWKQGIYDHTYWSFPYQSSRYSYGDYVINHSNGSIVVLNVDSLGVGLSSKPSLATDVTIDSNAYVIYQLTKMLY
ncbi:unnamed protein product [Rotaria sordida]|uniref:Uncharacterized protein n=1 Tax=Rotaria sordida TaxID=392033 RepID=A0A815TDF8_9BILA|nr:unnamed protein product [Rotaria sordida]